MSIFSLRMPESLQYCVSLSTIFLLSFNYCINIVIKISLFMLCNIAYSEGDSS